VHAAILVGTMTPSDSPDLQAMASTQVSVDLNKLVEGQGSAVGSPAIDLQGFRVLLDEYKIEYCSKASLRTGRAVRCSTWPAA
jgi:hypothetical protein